MNTTYIYIYIYIHNMYNNCICMYIYIYTHNMNFEHNHNAIITSAYYGAAATWDVGGRATRGREAQLAGSSYY